MNLGKKIETLRIDKLLGGVHGIKMEIMKI